MNRFFFFFFFTGIYISNVTATVTSRNISGQYLYVFIRSLNMSNKKSKIKFLKVIYSPILS